MSALAPLGRPSTQALLACAALLALHAALAWTAVSSKSSTVDEPMHALAAWTAVHHDDFRVDREDPVLWQYWIALPQGAGFVHGDGLPQRVWLDECERGVYTPFRWVRRTLYQTPGNDGEALVRRSRAASMALSVALGAVVAWWAYGLGGAPAAVVACSFYGLAPNFLAHGPLVKNDVALALASTACVAAVWRCGRRITAPALTAAVLLAAVAPNVKLSGLILAPVVAALLVVRALLRSPWEAFGGRIRGAAGRLAVASCLCAASALVFFAVTWGTYRFRFLPTRDASVGIDMRELFLDDSANAIRARFGPSPSARDVAGWRPGPLPRAIMYADEHRLLPQAYLGGLLYAHYHGLLRQAFLLGRVRDEGWWYYFPLAILFKTPATTLLAVLTASGYLAVTAARGRSGAGGDVPPMARPTAWDLACLAVPPIAYLTTAMCNNLNIGIRHVLPIYPFLFVAVGLAAARLWSRGVAARALVIAVPLCLAAETLWAYPDYIAFFNPIASAAGNRGMSLLADSNLDWGQDLPAVARWRRDHPEGTLFLRYYGTVDPSFYHIDHIDPQAPGAPRLAEVVAASTPDRPVYLAVSATYLQGLGVTSGEQTFYEALRKRRPFAVLNHTIYVYHIPPPRRPAQ